MDNETADDIKRHFDAVAKALRSDIRAVDEKVDRGFAAADRQFEAADRRFEAVDRRFDELRRHFDVVGDSLRGDIRLVAEGVTGLDEKFTREFVRVREEIGEVKSLVQVSYGNLDRRVQALEQNSS